MSNTIEELLATKLRALYQRKKGRDLYDFWYANQYFQQIDFKRIVEIFHLYMKAEKSQISRAEFEKNLIQKQASPIFNNDIFPLLTFEQNQHYQEDEAFEILFKDYCPRLSGEPWKGNLHYQA